MFIGCKLDTLITGAGKRETICTEVVIENTPREGYDNRKLGKLEDELRDHINKGLREAKASEEAV